MSGSGFATRSSYIPVVDVCLIVTAHDTSKLVEASIWTEIAVSIVLPRESRPLDDLPLHLQTEPPQQPTPSTSTSFAASTRTLGSSFAAGGGFSGELRRSQPPSLQQPAMIVDTLGGMEEGKLITGASGEKLLIYGCVQDVHRPREAGKERRPDHETENQGRTASHKTRVN